MNRRIRVSQGYADLRRAQREINRFVWSTEISYAFTRTSGELRSKSGALIDEVLSEIDTPAWHPPSREPGGADAPGEPASKVKYRQTVGDFLRDVERGSHFVCLTAMVMFSAAFETYLDSKPKCIREDSAKEKGAWGPYVQSLCRETRFVITAALDEGSQREAQDQPDLRELPRLAAGVIAAGPGIGVGRWPSGWVEGALSTPSSQWIEGPSRRSTRELNECRRQSVGITG